MGERMLPTHGANLQSSSLVQRFERFPHLYNQIPSGENDQCAKACHNACLKKFDDREHVCKGFTASSWRRDADILGRIEGTIETPFDF